MTSVIGLTSIRARAAYWQKRIELEKGLRRQQELEQMAWAEIMRLVVYHGTFEKSFAEACRQIGSLLTKPTTDSARAAGGRRGSKRID